VSENILKTNITEICNAIIPLCISIQKNYREFIMTNQLLRAVSSIGANYAEASYAQSRKAFLHQLNISRRECNESIFWVERLVKVEYIDVESATEYVSQLTVIMKMLSASCATAKKNAQNKRCR
jgi:four helix bundle protein